MLTRTVRHLFSDLESKAVLHFNQINNFHPVLQGAKRLVETIYRPDLRMGEAIHGLSNQDMTCLLLPDSSFDLAIHSDTLEHISDYEKALDEVRRIIKPGGYQIYTIPLLHGRKTRQRIALDAAGQAVNLLPLSGHGSEGEYPVVWEFGGDFLHRREARIFQVQYDNYWTNPTVFTVIERKPN
jgi:SAM-dependent methyltransferase